MNRPVNFNDPMGHRSCEGPRGECDEQYSTPTSLGQLRSKLKLYGVKLTGNWNLDNGLEVLYAVETVADSFSQILGSAPTDAYKDVYGITQAEQMEFEWVERTCDINGVTCWGFTPGARHIQIYETYFGIWDGNLYIASTPVSTGLILHEMGHAFNQRVGGNPLIGLRGDLLTRTRPNGFFADHYVGQFSHDTSQSEIFADMFLGWAVGMWGDNDLGRRRSDYMNGMNEWVLHASQLP